MSKPILGLSWLGPPSARLAKFNRQRGDWLGRILKQKFAGPKILPGNKRRKQQHNSKEKNTTKNKYSTQPLTARQEAKSQEIRHIQTRTHCAASINTTLPYRNETPKDPKNAKISYNTRPTHRRPTHRTTTQQQHSHTLLSRGRRRQRLPPPSPLLDKNRPP
ncbi:unnamed protein product, partial [Ectocarpus sp. 12 AP-2014]